MRNKRRLEWLAVFVALVISGSATAGPANTITITNESGAPQTNYPWQFGRPFVRGEIKRFPQVVINRTPVPTQADVKNRWPDGSVKYAVMAIIVPQIPAQGTMTISIQDQANGNNTPLSKEQMLDPAYNFDAQMRLAFTGDQTGVASARQMLKNGDFRLWTSGPVAQTIELADDTVAHKYDLGNSDGHYPFRPRFYATFWPATHQVSVRYVGENGLTTGLEDLRYSLTLALGYASPQTVYSIDLTGGPANGKLHWALTNWTRMFWEGRAPEQKINIDYNLAYLTATRFVPNYDTNLKVPDQVIADKYRLWTNKANDLYDAAWNGKGLWQSGMGSPGARSEIAPYPDWTIAWLYTGDWRTRIISLGMADLASAFPANLRESDPTKNLSRDDAPGAGTGLGHTLSISDRRTICLYRPDLFTSPDTKPEDRVILVAPVSAKWTFDGAHQPAPFYLSYILTGDPYYLNEMYNWAGFSAARYNGAAANSISGRGPTGAEGVINDELRGAGWVLRNRAEAAFAAPDTASEKHYFSYLTDDALARWEGGFGITGTVFDGNPVKQWGRDKGNSYSANNGPYSAKPPTLHNWESNGNPSHPEQNATIVNNEKTGVYQTGAAGSFTAPWMQAYVLYSLGRVKELGFAAGPILNYTGKWLVDLINDSGNPLLVGTYQVPVERAGGGFFNWHEILTIGFTASYLANALPGYFAQNLVSDGRVVWATPGMAYLVDSNLPGASKGWDWWMSNVYHKVPDFARNPKWAIVPRNDANTLPEISAHTPSSAEKSRR
jgi:hypothetical protein